MLEEDQVASIVGAIRNAEQEMDRHRAEVGRYARMRAELITQLRDGGLSAIVIADRLGVSRQTVHRALRGDT